MTTDTTEVSTPTTTVEGPDPIDLTKHMNLTPGNLLVAPELPPTHTPEGIELPSEIVNKPARVSTVVCTPKGLEEYLGIRIMHDQFVGVKWIINDGTYYLLNCLNEDGSFGGEVLATITDEVSIDNFQ